MLTLLDTPAWTPPEGPARPLPATVPAALLVHLAAEAEGRGGWCPREQLITLFWPDRPAGEGQHHLRVTLHRLRQLLHTLGQADALQAERSRLRLALPTDLARLHEAIAAADAGLLLQHRPRQPLQGLRPAGFDAFADWADEARARWLQRWRDGCDQALVNGLLRGEDALLRPLFQAWLQSGGGHGTGLDASTSAGAGTGWPGVVSGAPGGPGLPSGADGRHGLPGLSAPPGLPGVRALDPARLGPAAQATWRHVCARLAEPGADTAPAADGPAHATAPARPPRTAPARAVEPLPGREADQDALRASAAPALVVLGEPGAGKSSLLRSCWPAAPWLQGREGLGNLPWAPVLEWLHAHEALLRTLQQPGGPVAAYRLDLARLLPELAPDEPLPPLDAHTAKARLFEALARVFASQGPVLLVDDLQWLDLATLEWLVFMAHRPPLRWRASARPHALAGPAQQALAALQAAQRLQRQPLAPLDAAGLAQACRARWPHQPWSDAVLQALHQASAGNPFVLGELVAQGAVERLAAGDVPALPPRVLDLVGQRLQGQGAAVQALVEAAAILGRPAPLPLLASLCDGLAEAQAWPACAQALAAELLREDEAGLQCQHDLIRSAAAARLSPARRRWLHRRAALALGDAADSEALIVAGHWEAAQELPNALAWLHRAAQQQKQRGRFDEARALWQRVAAESRDSTLALRAQLALAECLLYDDLAAGRQALEQVLAEAAAVADERQRHQITGQALAGLVDNAVFSGDLPRAARLAARLRPLLPRLPTEDRVHACEVLIELAMREPDIPGARALLEQVRRLAPRHPSTLSFAGQIHWFAGDARAAREAFQALLAQHPDYCSALTIENDLAVFHHALGELADAEAMARRSLASWRGVAHTEALSQLVLGTVLVSAGRHEAARDVLDQALAGGRAQGSALFEAEALVRRARLWLHCARPAAARTDLDAAAPLLAASTDPLRVSQYAVLRAQLQWTCGEPIDPALAERLRQIALRSLHPLLQARLARIEALAAWQAGQLATAADAALRGASVARAAGLPEPLAEALLLAALIPPAAAAPAPDDAAPLLHEAAALADTHGLPLIGWRAHGRLAALTLQPAHAAAARQAVEVLRGPAEAAGAAGAEPLFDLDAASTQPL